MNTNLISKIQTKTETTCLLELPAHSEILRWASENFRQVIGLSQTAEITRSILADVDNIRIIGREGRGLTFANYHLVGRTLAIIHTDSSVTIYQIVMFYLRDLLLETLVTCVIIESAKPMKSILDGLLDQKRFSMEWVEDDLIIYKLGVSMETPWI